MIRFLSDIGRRFNFKLCLVLTWTVLLDFTTAQATVAPPFSEIQQMVQEKNYVSALELLKQIPRQHSASYFYNLGVVSYRLNNFGAARAYFEKAQRLKPFDDDILHNLWLTKEKLIEKVGSTNLDPSGTSFYELLNSNWAQVLLFGISLIAIGLSAGIALRLLRGQKLSTLLSSGTTFAWMIFIALHVMASIVSSPLDDAVLVEPGVVRSGPGDHFLRLFSAPAGMRVILKDEMQTDGLGKPWVQILSGEDQIGWIQESILLPLSGAWVRPRERKLK